MQMTPNRPFSFFYSELSDKANILKYCSGSIEETNSRATFQPTSLMNTCFGRRKITAVSSAFLLQRYEGAVCQRRVQPCEPIMVNYIRPERP